MLLQVRGPSPLELLAQSGGQAASLSGSYPPALQGLRGSHVGFETGHAMRDGQSWTSSMPAMVSMIWWLSAAASAVWPQRIFIESRTGCSPGF